MMCYKSFVHSQYFSYFHYAQKPCTLSQMCFIILFVVKILTVPKTLMTNLGAKAWISKQHVEAGLVCNVCLE